MSPHARLIALSLAGLVALSLAPATIGQAAPPVVSPSSVPDGALGSFSALGAGTSGSVSQVVLADDTVYVGGFFNDASGVTGTNFIAAWSDDTWQPLGTGTNSQMSAMTLADDTLYVGGFFGAASGVPGTTTIAAWSDDTWFALGTGTNNAVRALAVSSDGTLYAGGSFTDASGVAVNRIASWSNNTWSALAGGTNGAVNALAVAADDTVYVGGGFTTASGVTANRIAAWSNGTWSALGTGMVATVDALAVAADGTVYAGGGFTAASGVTGTSRISAWSDDTWSALDVGLGGTVRGIAVDDTRGLVYAGGSFTGAAGGAANSLNFVGVWDAGVLEWIPFTYAGGNGTPSQVNAVAVDDSVVYLGGSFQDAGGVTAADRIARWTWEPPQGSNSLSALANASVTLTGEGFIGVPATGGVKVGSTVATYTRDDSATITMTVPAGTFTNAPITVDGVGGWGEVGVLNPASPPEPTPPPVFPPSAPASVSGVGGDGSAVLSWAAPASSGSFPISSYQAVVSPGGQSCLVVATALTCTITGLTNGTAYTATVRALNGAGWGPYSAASAAFTPRPSVSPSITITGMRTEVRGKPGVVVTGTTTGFEMGAMLRPWTRFPGQTSYTQGAVSILVDVQGGFTWERRTGKTIYISIRSDDAAVESNRLILRRA